MTNKTMRDRALDELKEIWKITNELNMDDIAYDFHDWESYPHEKRNEIFGLLKYMKNNGWIKVDFGCLHWPASIQLTNLGIDIVEKTSSINQPQTVQNTFNVSNNTGVLAVNANNITINNGISFDEIEKMIKNNISDNNDCQQLLSEIKSLKEILETNNPLEKGMLEGIGSKLQKYSWLAAPLADNLFQYLFSLDPLTSLTNLISVIPSKRDDV